jgi:glycogen operon protein
VWRAGRPPSRYYASAPAPSEISSRRSHSRKASRCSSPATRCTTTQQGNNNAYCQDSELTWIDWNLDEGARDLLAFTRQVFAIRAANPVLRRHGFFLGPRELSGTGLKDVAWFRPDGQELTELDWHDPQTHVLGMLIHGQATDEKDDHGRPVIGRTLLLLVNGGARPARFTLPRLGRPGDWHELVHTARPSTRTSRPTS